MRRVIFSKAREARDFFEGARRARDFHKEARVGRVGASFHLGARGAWARIRRVGA